MKKIMLIIILLIVCLFCFVACNNNIKYSVAYLGSYKGAMLESLEWNIKQIVKTTKELEHFALEYEVLNYIDKYDEDYFVDKAIIVCLFNYSHLNANLSVKSVRINEATIQINIIEKQSKDAQYPAAEEYWICVIEVDLKDIKNINDVEMVINVKRGI